MVTCQEVYPQYRVTRYILTLPDPRPHLGSSMPKTTMAIFMIRHSTSMTRGSMPHHLQNGIQKHGSVLPRLSATMRKFHHLITVIPLNMGPNLHNTAASCHHDDHLMVPLFSEPEWSIVHSIHQELGLSLLGISHLVPQF